MNAFITGSRAYGRPRPDSDVDLVVLIDDMDSLVLEHESETQSSIRFGNLNIIPCSDKAKFETWRRVTEELISRDTTVSREEAIAEFEKNGIEPTEYEKRKRIELQNLKEQANDNR